MSDLPGAFPPRGTEEAAELRLRIRGREFDQGCMKLMAELACNTEYGGALDPRSAALEAISRKGRRCRVTDCKAEFTVNTFTDSYLTVEECDVDRRARLAGDFCLENAWNENGGEGVRDACRKTLSPIAYTYHCPQSNCDFRSGITEDIVRGSNGVCAQRLPGIAVPMPEARQ